eukprot:1330-Rhodomonas_salina.1
MTEPPLTETSLTLVPSSVGAMATCSGTVTASTAIVSGVPSSSRTTTLTSPKWNCEPQFALRHSIWFVLS